MTWSDISQILTDGGILALIGVVFTTLVTRRGTRAVETADNLERGAKTWREIGEYERERSRVVEAENAVLRDDIERLMNTIREVLMMVKENETWERLGGPPPPPHTLDKLVITLSENLVNKKDGV